MERLPRLTFSQAVEVTQKEASPQDTLPSGQSNAISTPPPSIEKDSPMSDSSSQISQASQMSLFDTSKYQTCLSEEVLARISRLQEIDPGLKAIAVNCFLSTSDFCGYSNLKPLSLRTSKGYSLTTTARHSPESLPRLQKWGMWGLGSYEMETDTSPKTDQEFSWWVFTGDVRATKPMPYKRSLADCLGGLPVNSCSGDVIDHAFKLQASTYKLGKGNQKHPNTFVLYKSAEGDRLYTDNAPCLRSLASTNGHQTGCGAYKVREFQGEQWLERPITATEAERLMGWEEGCTAKGIDVDGNVVGISTTQRIKMLGNGIIPQEITEILEGLKEAIA